MNRWVVHRRRGRDREYRLDASPDELNRLFYQGYDPDALSHKTEAIEYVLSHLGDFTAWRHQQQQQHHQQHPTEHVAGDEPEWWWEPDYRFAPALDIELYFTAIHQFEAFLALVVAACQDMPHWMYLTWGYQPGDMEDKAEQLVAGDIAALTNGQYVTPREFVAQTIYGGRISHDEETQRRWDENLDNVFALLQYMGGYFRDGLGGYNSYKHGIRLVIGNLAQMSTTSGILRVLAERGIAYLTAEPDGRVVEVAREIFPEESIYFLRTMRRLQQTVADTRLAAYEPGVAPRLHTFFDIPRDRLNTWAQKQQYRNPQ